MSTRDLFDALSEKYDEWYEKHRDLYKSELQTVSRLDCQGGVEIGVGTGRFAAPLGLRIGVDPSVNMLRLAPKTLDLIAAVGEMLPLRDGAVGCALIVVTLCFADDPKRLLNEALRVARRVVACIVPRESPWAIRYMEEGKQGHPFYSRAKFYAIRDLLSLASDARPARIYATLKEHVEGLQPVEEPPLDQAERYGFVCVELIRDGDRSESR